MDEPVFDQTEPVRNSQHEMAHLKPTPLRCMGVTNRRNEMWDSLTNEEKVAQVRREVEAGALPLGEPHKEVWLVQAFEETICNMEPNTTPLFTYAFTNEEEAEKVREVGLAVKLPYVMWTLDRVVLDAAEDATRHISMMVAINARENDYYDKEIL